MAGNMSSGYSDEEDGAMSAINVTPLVDVTLVLLIVFMITVPVIVGSARVKVDVPETTSVEPEPEQLPLVFALKQNDKQQNTLYLNDNPIDEAGLQEDVRRLEAQQRSSGFIIGRSRHSVRRGDEVIDMLESLGLKKLALDTRHVEQR